MSSISPILSRAFQSAGIDPSLLTSSGNTFTSKDGTQYFARTSRDIKQITGEVESLRALGRACQEVVPRLYAFEVQNGEGAMVSQYFDLGGSSTGNTQRELARRIAKLHTPLPAGSEGAPKGFGFHVPTHCGVTEQNNTWEESWEVFFRDRRLGDLVRRIGDKQITQAWDHMQGAVSLLLQDITPPPQPVILHGDLWSGNKGIDRATGQPVVFDPSSYFGHNEADLGIMHMFGGVGPDFFDEYHKVHPRSEPHYHQRIKLYELYHHLNVSCAPVFGACPPKRGKLIRQHTLMFGGGYRTAALKIMRDLARWSDDNR